MSQLNNRNKRLIDADALSVRIAAMDMLARREHSFAELIGKLLEKGADQQLAHEVVSILRDEGLQSDERFAEAFVNARIGRGQGPMKIQLELGQHRIDERWFDRALAEHAVDWAEQATEVYKKKYGTSLPDDYNERAKRMRFLQGRGFSPDQVRRAMEMIKQHQETEL